MFGVCLKATNISLQKRITFCRSIYLKSYEAGWTHIRTPLVFKTYIVSCQCVYICGSLIKHASVAIHFVYFNALFIAPAF